MENEEEAETVGDEVTANTENFNCDSHLLERVVIMMETIWQSIITTTWTEQSFCLSSKEVELSSKDKIQVFSGRDIKAARPDDGDDNNDGNFKVVEGQRDGNDGKML